MPDIDTAKEELIEHLAEIPDPEIPVINIVELGIVRDVEEKDDGLHVTITPTYSGCPAMAMITRQIIEHMRNKGHEKVFVRTVFKPAWTTDWITPQARQRMKEYGIAPPGMVMDQDVFDFKPKPVTCPFCDSNNTRRQAEFGSTPCKAQYYCDGCEQPFEYFKCH